MAFLKKGNEIDMINGPLWGKIISFSLPVILTNLLQVFYNAADMMVVGLSSEPDAVSAIGTTAALTALIVNVFVGFATGANVVVAHHIGAGEEKQTSRAVHTALSMALVFGLLSAVFGLVFGRPILRMMKVEGKLLSLAALYVGVYSLGMPFMAVTNYASAILRAKGDAQTPLVILSLSGLFNVIANLIFVLACGMSVEGVALATTLANAISAVLLLRRLYLDEGPCRFSPRLLGFEKKSFLKILYIGLPAGIQASLFHIPNLIVQSSVVRLNNLLCPDFTEFSPVVKGHAAAQNIGTFVSTANTGFVQAAITFAGQNAGAKKPRRVWRVLGISLLIDTAITAVLAVGIFLLRDPLFGLYGVVAGADGSPERIAYETAFTRISIVLLSFPLAAFMDVCSGVAKGLGKAISSTVVALIGTCVLRVVWIYTVFDHFLSSAALYVCYPITWAVTGLVLFVMLAVVLRKQTKQRDATDGKT
jgi:putative MATE family efflux protein